ncbi:tyrosine-protein phosphatase [Shewanella sp.]|uniref:tyrosine-protein phosphatase n=1 Tax=Shewanella sp. TaxID=50422 RepID=UPI003A9699CA
MYDIHCHVIPNIDDGARTMDEALALLQLAHSSGISHVVATPHMHPGIFDNTPASIHQGLQQLKQHIQDEGLDLQLAAAAEVRLCAELPRWIEADEVPYLGEYQGYKVLLLEFPHSHIPVGAEQLVKWLIGRDILPMIAHPERNRDVQKNIKKLLPFRRMNCLLQLTASSVIGDMGEASLSTAVDLLEDNAVDVVATDAHNMHRRPPKLAEAHAAIAAVYGQEYADKLTKQTPAQISQALYS